MKTKLFSFATWASLALISFVGCIGGQESEGETVDVSESDLKVAVCQGDYLVTDAASASQIQNCGKIEGSLTIQGASVSTISTPWLVSIAGDLVVDGTNISSLSFPKLRLVGGEAQVQLNEKLTTVSIPNLSAVGSHLLFANNPLLKSAGFPFLTDVFGNVEITNNDAITSLSLPTLSSIDGTFSVTGNESLTTVDVSLLETVGGGFLLKDTQFMTALSAPKLVTIGGGIEISYVKSMLNVSFPVLTNLGTGLLVRFFDGSNSVFSIPNLEEIPGEMSVYSVSVLDFEMPKLSIVNDAHISNNIATYFKTSGAVAVEKDFIANGLLQSFSFPVTTVGGSLYVNGNTQCSSKTLISVNFSELTFVGKNVSVSSPSTSSGCIVSQFNAPKLATIMTDLTISRTLLSSLSGLSFLRFVGGALKFSSNPNLDNSDYCALAQQVNSPDQAKYCVQ